MTYADNNKAHFVAIIGENEISENKLTLKNMLTGEQEMVTLEVAIEKILEK